MTASIQAVCEQRMIVLKAAKQTAGQAVLHSDTYFLVYNEYFFAVAPSTSPKQWNRLFKNNTSPIELDCFWIIIAQGQKIKEKPS